MAKLVVNGKKRLCGTVKVSGAKNAALPILAAALLLDGTTELINVPHLMDISTMIKMLNSLGLRAEYLKPCKVRIVNNKKIKHIAPYELVTAMRASFFVAGPLVARTGFAKVPLPGGCSIGSRPIDLHLKGFKALGCQINIEHGFVEIKAKQLVGKRIYLDFPSVGATENIMMAATLAQGTTIIENAALEPEIEDLGNFLNNAGANISGLGTAVIKIIGVSKLKGIEHTVIPDRVEAGTLLIAGAITNGAITIENCIPIHIEPLLQKLQEAGFKLEIKDNSIALMSNRHIINPINIETLPFPGFPTDMQAQMMSLLCLAQGTSLIKELIFENRFMHAYELMRMGANIKLDRHLAFIEGVPSLSGAAVKITDLRAGAALILAGLAAEGQTTVYGLKHLQRGYENLPEKLKSLGADITS
jgi:UDP-N-acetylglucosamine 1-carboxyvinyltransferase